MKKNKFLIITIVGLLISNLFLIGFLVMHKPHKGHKSSLKKFISSNLSFSDQQMEEYEKLIKNHQSAMAAVDDEILNLKTKLYAQLGGQDAPIDQDSIFQQLQTRLTDREKIHLSHFAEIKEICTPDQMQAFTQLMSEVQNVFGGKRKGVLKHKEK